MRTLRSISVLVCVVGMTMMAGAEGASDLPPNISVGSDLRYVVEDMLRESGTFRSQSRLLGKMPHVRVSIQLEEHPGGVPDARARCDLKRYELGAITAIVHVRSRPDAIELIGHELEHVIEFAEGTNYRIMALLQPGSVWALRGGSFETTRAVDAGLRVKQEAWLATAQLRARR